MSFNAASLRLMLEKGLTLDDVVEIAAANESRSKAAERQARYRKRKRGDVTDDYVTRDVTPSLKEETSKPSEPNGAKAPSLPLADRVVEAWNGGPAKRGARAARALDASRRKLLSLREREHGEAAVFEAIRNLAASPFHCGENERGWRANIGWLLKAENFLKMLEMTPVVLNGAAKPTKEPETIADLERALAVARDRGWTEQPMYVRYREKLDGLKRRQATGPPGRPLGTILATAGHGAHQ